MLIGKMQIQLVFIQMVKLPVIQINWYVNNWKKNYLAWKQTCLFLFFFHLRVQREEKLQSCMKPLGTSVQKPVQQSGHRPFRKS